MRTGKELILATKPFASDSTAKSWGYVLSTAALLALSLAGAVWNFHLAAKLACSLMAGMLILRLFVIYHDQQHYAILSKSKVAEWLMKIFGILSLSPSSVWRSSHNYHHNHNSQLRGSHIGSFPVMTRNQFLKCSRGRQIKYLFIRHPLTILFGYIFAFLFGMCLYPFFNKPKEHFDCAIAFVVHFIISAALLYFFGWQTLVLAQIIPHFVACAIGTYLFYAQHNFPGVSFYDRLGWAYEKAALDSSSYMRTGPVMGWFTANIGYHHIHHLNARVPFYRLPEVFHAIPELSHPKTTSLHPAEIIRCLRLKLWDVEAQKMIPVPRKAQAKTEPVPSRLKQEVEVEAP
ncbi:MAG: fatty acid desaturase [Akkermansiaceae bacterium]|nr:fatty acid desaturase [Verrucomicrobiales bacterium]